MYEVGERYDYEGPAERDGESVMIDGTFVCAVVGDTYARLRDVRYDADDSPFAAHPAELHTFKVSL